MVQTAAPARTCRSGWKQDCVLTTLGYQTFTTEKVTVCQQRDCKCPFLGCAFSCFFSSLLLREDTGTAGLIGLELRSTGKRSFNPPALNRRRMHGVLHTSSFRVENGERERKQKKRKDTGIAGWNRLEVERLLYLNCVTSTTKLVGVDTIKCGGGAGENSARCCVRYT